MTMREQLQALVEQFRGRLLSADIADVRCIFDKFDLQQLESILATPEPAVTVRKGWVCKDKFGLWYYAMKPKWSGYWYGIRQRGLTCEKVSKIITDPWPDHPNGGPECLMEVK